METSELLRHAQGEAAARVAQPGDWLDGHQRVAVWREVRDAAANPLDRARRAALSPYAVPGGHGPAGPLAGAAVEVVHRVASDPGRLTRSWAERSIAELGEATYVELVGVTAIVTVLDWFDRARGEPERPVPAPVAGDPARRRPEGVGDVGAWVAQAVGKPRANVSRALSLVPVTESAWAPLVTSHYSRGPEFFELVWERDLSRPQVELVAARTTALNECFY
jgi:hypothetical protein